MSLQEAEARTIFTEILTAVKRAKDEGIFHIIVASYAHEVVKAIDGEDTWALGSILLDILSLPMCFESINVPRSYNQAAHS